MRYFLLMFIVGLFLVSVLVTPSFADQCHIIDEKVAKIVSGYLREGMRIVEYCEPCQDKKSPQVETIQTLNIFESKFHSGEWFVSINNSTRDIAYIFVDIDSRKFMNLGRFSGCGPHDVSTFLPNHLIFFPREAPAPAPNQEYQNTYMQKHVYFEPLRRIPDERARQYVEHLKQWLEDTYPALKNTFIFPDFNIYVRYCGTVNAFSDPNITLCNELIAELYNANLTHALKWTFLHELGHTLLRLWDYPLWDNEDAADEFATVFLFMWGGESGKNIAKWAAYEFRTQSPHLLEYIQKIFVNARHSFSVQRARNIEYWINNEEELKRRWLRIFVPHLQTIVLRKMLESPASWVDTALVERELKNR